jgi:uncharacterized lipoprotein YddW (UPF0748 family)
VVGVARDVLVPAVIGAAVSAAIVAASVQDGTASSSADQAGASPAEFARALWVVRSDLTDGAAVDEALERAARLGCTDVFLQVRGRGDAYYASRLVPAGQDLTEGFDALAAALPAARELGLRVHAWLNVLLVWSAPELPESASHVANAHPGWFVPLETRGGRKPSLEVGRRELDRLAIEGHFLAPDHPGVVKHLEAVVRELVAGYAVDGLHLDYIRYPDRQVDPHGGADAVSELVERLAGTARRERPGIIVSAAVYPKPGVARDRKGQTWPGWLESGAIDLAVPMCYGPSRSEMLAELRAARQIAGRLWAGVALYNKPLDVALLGVEGARDLGFAGAAIFSHAVVRDLGPTGEVRLRDALAVEGERVAGDER